MIPQTKDYFQEEASRESRAAIDALTRCTLIQAGYESGEPINGGLDQQAVENYWCGRFRTLMNESVTAFFVDHFDKPEA